MLSYDIRELEKRAVQVASELAPDDPVWAADDPRPASPIRVAGRLSRAGSGRYYWSGRIEGPASLDCRRCLAELSIEVAEDIHLIFAEAGDEVGADPDTYRLPPHAEKIDLAPAIRDQWLLAVPGFALCREDCRGICARCGADLNDGPCDCPPESDNRWEALRVARPVSE